MELSVVTKDDQSIEIEFKGENDTLLNLLKQRLLDNPKVVSATYLKGHPSLDEPRLYIETSDKKAADHLKAAAKELKKEFDAFETLFLKAK